MSNWITEQAPVGVPDGLQLRPMGHIVGAGVRLELPIGCSHIGVAYKATRGQGELLVAKELIPALSPLALQKLASQLERTSSECEMIEPQVLARQWVDGVPLETMLMDRGGDPAEAASLGAIVALELQSLHERGIVHGGVHERNILMTPSRPVLVDALVPPAIRDNGFRLLKGKVFDSTLHVAPERLRGLPSAEPGDWYSLGTVIWRVSTGRPPYFLGDTAAKKSTDCEFDSVFLERPEFVWLKALLTDLLTGDPAKRLSDGRVIVDAFQRKAYVRHGTSGLQAPGPARQERPAVEAPRADKTRRAPGGAFPVPKGGGAPRWIWRSHAVSMTLGAVLLATSSALGLQCAAYQRQEQRLRALREENDAALQMMAQQTGRERDETMSAKNQAEARNATVLAQLAEREANVKQYAALLGKKDGEVQQHLTQLEMVRKELAALLTQNRDMRSERLNLQARTRDLEEQLQRSREEVRALTARLSELQQARDRLQRELESSRKGGTEGEKSPKRAPPGEAEGT